MSRSSSLRHAVVLLPAVALALAWLACGEVESSEATADADVTDAATLVVGDAQCPDCGAGLLCVYDPAEGCTAKGTCIVAFTGLCRATPDVAYCPCDAGHVPPYVMGSCLTFEKPEEPVQDRSFGTGPCFPLADE
jgi:hypothetical protein